LYLAVGAELVEAGRAYPYGLSLSIPGCARGLAEGVHASAESGGRDVAPAGKSLSFGSPKERNQRKGDPTGCVPALRSAAPSRAQAPRAAKARPSKATARVAVWLSHPLLAAPAAGRLRGGTGALARVLRDLTRRGCPSGAAQRQSEFHGAPRNRPAAGLPLRNAKGSQTGGRLFFAYFLLAKQKKVSRPPGRQPGSHPPTRHTAKSATKPRFRQAQPERLQGATQSHG
jgi:hypothetical protein